MSGPTFGRRAGCPDAGFASGCFDLSSRPRRRRSLPLITVQPSFSTIPCIYFYFPVNSALPFPVFYSPNSSILSSSRRAPSFFFPSSGSVFCHTQFLPTFFTPSKHLTRRNAHNLFPFKRILHTSLDTPGGGTPHLAPRPASLLRALLSPLEAINTRLSASVDSKSLIKAQVV